MLEVAIYDEDGCVVLQVESPDGDFEIAMSAEVADEWIDKMSAARDAARRTKPAS
jgi:hypothetical protein